jgi:Porin PorA
MACECMNAISARWHAIKKLRSNLVLVGAGCVLVLLALSWRVAIAPALEVVPTNIENVLYFDGTLTSYLNPPGQPPAGNQPVRVPVSIERRMRSLPVQSTPNTAMFEVETAVLVKESREQISANKRLYAVDRHTSKMANRKNAERVAPGYFLVFPYNTPRSTLPYWSPLTGRTTPARYQKSRAADKLNVYVFQTEFGGQPGSRAPEGFPGSISGAELKAMLSMPDLPVAGAAVYELSYIASGALELAVEPRSGTIVEERAGQESVSLTVAGAGGETVVTRLIYKLDYAQNSASVQHSVDLARDEMAAIRLQFVYLPLGLLAVGVVLFLIGAFAGVKVDREAGKTA